MTIVNFYFTEREHDRMEEKRQRLEERRQRESTSAAPTTFASKVPDEKPEAMRQDEKENAADADATATNNKANANKKALKIEVHATATHHEHVEPVIAHAQTHEFSHSQGVSRQQMTTCALQMR